MPDSRRLWTQSDIAKLKSMAGRLALKDIATKLGRSRGATAIEASKLRISLRTRPAFGVARQTNASLER
jgi:hypothetical protein